jgi:tripartite ATP-independent transporter DctM subunit
VGGTVSIGHLLVAGFFPGLLLGGSLAILVLIVSYKENYPKTETVPFRQAIKAAVEALWGLVTMVIITGGIVGGIFTATEAAAVACVWAFLVTMFVYRDYRWRDLHLLVHRTMKTVGMVMMLIAFASSFGYIMALMQLPAHVTSFFLTVSDNKYVILFLINILLLFLGTLMDMAPLILICAPILLPVVQTFGVDPVHFGVIMLVNLGIGLITPPVGSVLFVGCAVAKLSIEQVTRKIWPFYVAMFIVLMLVTYIPAISIWLPRLIVD